jgi:hypothetical protein
MYRARFYSSADDPRPVHWPIKHPYWITGEDFAGNSTIVAYADDEQYIKDNWPEATQIEMGSEVNDYVFTSRFPRPEWLKDTGA